MVGLPRKISAGESCGEKTNCLVYDTDQLRLNLGLMATASMVLATCCDAAIWFLVGDLELYDDDGDGDGDGDGDEKDGKAVAFSNSSSSASSSSRARPRSDSGIDSIICGNGVPSDGDGGGRGGGRGGRDGDGGGRGPGMVEIELREAADDVKKK